MLTQASAIMRILFSIHANIRDALSLVATQFHILTPRILLIRIIALSVQAEMLASQTKPNVMF